MATDERLYPDDPETYTLEYARSLDAKDPLRHFREEFIIPSKADLKRQTLPKRGTYVVIVVVVVVVNVCQSLIFSLKGAHSKANHDGQQEEKENGDDYSTTTSTPCIYLSGNSLGLQPRQTAAYIQAHLDTWATKGVYGHFELLTDSPLPAFLDADEHAARLMAGLVGARADEVAVMQTLTANLHLMLASFYRPTRDRWKIVLESRAFPSDHVWFLSVEGGGRGGAAR